MQRLSADDTSKQRVKVGPVFKKVNNADPGDMSLIHAQPNTLVELFYDHFPPSADSKGLMPVTRRSMYTKYILYWLADLV